LPENKEEYFLFLVNTKGIAKSMASATAALNLLTAASTDVFLSFSSIKFFIFILLTQYV
jgi:hypothetical protein